MKLFGNNSDHFITQLFKKNPSVWKLLDQKADILWYLTEHKKSMIHDKYSKLIDNENNFQLLP